MMNTQLSSPTIIAPLISLLLACYGCTPFRTLGENLKFMEHSSIVTVQLHNSKTYKNLKGVIIEYHPHSHKIRSADFANINNLGLFGFFVTSPDNQYIMAYSDQNNNLHYDSGEPAWIASDAQGDPKAIDFAPSTHKAKLKGSLSRSTKIPSHLMGDLQQFKQGRSRDEVISKLTIPITLGDIGNLDSPRFSAAQGESGLWEPASFPLHSGIGVYFLEKYDSTKTPVLFVYGAAGSPQDWRMFFDKIDRKKYQPWFFYYPTGRRLDEMANALNTAVNTLHNHYQFQQLHVVAHSMGGMVARAFVVKNVLEDQQPYIQKLVTIATPWGGHEAAAMGVKHAPKVVPSWRDMAQGSTFQKNLYRHHIKGKVKHLLIYGDEGKKSLIMPDENDGTVSVASETFPPILQDATQIQRIHATHTSILTKPEVIRSVGQFLNP